jgi:hypothetical protein
VQELDTQELDLADEEASSGRHRAPASAARKVALRLALAAVGVLLASGFGAVAADLVGLTDLGLPSQGAFPQPVPQDREEEPRPGRATGLIVGDVSPAPESAAPSPDVQLRDASAADAPAPESDPVTPPVPPASVPTVRTGDSCPAVGQTGVTARGDAAVCTASPGHGPDKWRVA